MIAASWQLITAASLAILAGAAVAFFGAQLLSELFSGKGIPVGAAGMFMLLTMVAGPLLTLGGVSIILAGFKLLTGHAWARSVLDIFSWIVLCGSIAWILYGASEHRHIHAEHVIAWARFFLLTGAPAIVLLLLLRSDAIGRAITR